jgi:hypothetical protein
MTWHGKVLFLQEYVTDPRLDRSHMRTVFPSWTLREYKGIFGDMRSNKTKEC